MISIIIPALNEKERLPILLESIKNQDFADYEIIVADANSTDKTLEIAKEYDCKIVVGGLPAKGRNEGTKIAKGEIFFFLDADTFLPNNFLNKTLSEFNNRKLDLASFCLSPMPKKIMSSFFLNIFYNQPIILLQNILPHAATGMLVKKDLFEQLGGFDEDVKLAEDHYLARRARKTAKAKCGIIKSVKLYVSDRRFRKDGWFIVGFKYLLCELHMIFIGPVKSDIFKYRFNHYNKIEK